MLQVNCSSAPIAIEEVVTELSDERLIIKQESWRFNLKEKVNIYITMPEVEGLSVSGSGRVRSAQ